MEIPDRLETRLEDENVRSAVTLGDEDIICFTPTRTLLYSGEGLLSDESITEFDHDIERLDISSGRRKMSFTLEYVDRTESFSVASSRGEAVLEHLLASVLDAAGVLEPDESVEGVYRFSEMTLVVTDARLVKHIGSYVWDADFEEFPYEDVTGLEFEEGSVATSIVLSVDGRPERIKAPNDEAALLRRTLTEVLCDFHDVESLAQLNDKLSETDDTEESGSVADDISLDNDISPLVGGESTAETSEEQTREESTSQSATTTDSGSDDSRDEAEAFMSKTSTPETTSEPAVDPEDIEAIESQLATLTEAVKRQNEHLKNQQQTIEQLIKELRRQN